MGVKYLSATGSGGGGNDTTHRHGRGRAIGRRRGDGCRAAGRGGNHRGKDALTAVYTAEEMAKLPKRAPDEHKRFPMREDRIYKIEVHVAGICVREEARGRWKLLAARRSSERSLFPGKWECGGGMVHPGESFEGAIQRQIFEEFGLEIKPWFLAETYTIHVPIPRSQRIIPGVRWTCLSPSGQVRLNLREFSECRWLNLPLADSLDWIGGIGEAIERVTPRILNERK